MAGKSNRGRIVIWTIVGILVVIAVIFLIAGRGQQTRGEREISAEDVPGFVARMEGRLEKTESRVAKAMSDYDAPEEFARIDELLETVRTGLSEIQTMDDQEAVRQKMEEIKDAYNEAKGILTDLD